MHSSIYRQASNQAPNVIQPVLTDITSRLVEVAIPPTLADMQLIDDSSSIATDVAIDLPAAPIAADNLLAENTITRPIYWK